ncbi:hypothetical protein A0H81_10226 [Grifola frondosa]|uniref:Uncharacterized protein n=1 Tax=Grifola frondosa TaxID=5627 RepID=A0A1C7LY26_GRIFR|nr:hypothetical protein A0H81_10226 [Grifola frondosa]
MTSTLQAHSSSGISIEALTAQLEELGLSDELEVLAMNYNLYRYGDRKGKFKPLVFLEMARTLISCMESPPSDLLNALWRGGHKFGTALDPRPYEKLRELMAEKMF